MGFLEMLRTSYTALRAHKLRTMLSILGIVIGVAAVVAIVSLVSGATSEIKQQIAALGMRTISITIYPQAVSSAAASRTLTEELTSKLIALDSVSQVVPTASTRGNVIVDAEAWNATIMGVRSEYLNLFDGFYAASGRFVHALDEDRMVAVLGASLASTYFGGKDPVGERLTVEISGDKIAFQIIGTMSERGVVGYQDLDNMVYVPFSTAQRITGSRQITSYIAQAASEELIEQAAVEIELLLEATLVTTSTAPLSGFLGRPAGAFFGGQMGARPYAIQVQKEAIQTYQESVNTMTLILGGVGAISLLVGGIGIMNIMLVSVTERTREIGILMATGARPADIRAQFLVEAILISFFGGLIGLGFGWLCAWFGSLFGDWPFVISVYPALLACGFSVLIGVTFGLYPALRAAQLDPVDALRYE